MRRPSAKSKAGWQRVIPKAPVATGAPGIDYDGKEISFVVPGNPVSKQRPRFGSDGSVHTPVETRQYEAHVRFFGLKARQEAQVSGYLGRPGVWPMDRQYELIVSIHKRNKNGDLDNKVKAIMDGLNRTLYEDDGQVTRLVAESFEDRDDPRAVVTVRIRPRPAGAP